MLGNRLQSSDHGKHKQIEVCIWIGLHFQLNAWLKSLMQKEPAASSTSYISARIQNMDWSKEVFYEQNRIRCW
jgi:hypothetical protein